MIYEDESFEKFLDDIPGFQPDEETEETSPEGPEMPTQDSPEEESQPEPQEVEEEAEESSPAEDSPEEPEPASEPQTPEPTPLQYQEDLVVKLSDGRQVTMKELVEGNLRWKDYTQKTQEVAEARRSVEEALQQRDSLYVSVWKDPSMRAFLSAHPDALENLLQRPEDTRAILGNEELIGRYWHQYEILKDNPELAERLARADQAESARRDLESRAEQEDLVKAAAVLDGAVRRLADELGGKEVFEQFANTYMPRCGLTPAVMRGEHGDEAILEGLRRVRALYVPGGNVDLDLVRDHLELVKSRLDAKAQAEAAKKAKHNAQVDAELKAEEERVPAPKESSSPTEPKEDEYKKYEGRDFSEYLDSI